ncbi:MAG: phytanoyl-CoA dioxygenase family protein, partial [Myxococcota bacterium]|nr:phytanoyl-CoA dioxygenase family protein [Myxococcota bacterium]
MLTPGQRDALDTLGWTRVPGVIAPRACDALVDAAHQLLAVAEASGAWPAPRADGPDVVNLPRAVRGHPALDAWLRSGAVGALARAALDARRVRLLQDAVLHKPAGCAGVVPWHCDHTYVGYLRPARVVSVRVALTPSTPESGCLEV